MNNPVTAQAARPVVEPQVQEQAAQIERHIANLRSNIGALENKLKQVLVSEPNPGTAETPKPTLVPLAEHLRAMAENAEHLNSLLLGIIRRVEV